MIRGGYYPDTERGEGQARRLPYEMNEMNNGMMPTGCFVRKETGNGENENVPVVSGNMKKFEDVFSGEVFESSGFIYYKVPLPEVICECEFCEEALLDARSIFTDNLLHFCPDDIVRQVDLKIKE